MAFRFYIVTLADGEITGTDDRTVAQEFAMSDEYAVVDTVLGSEVTGSGWPLPSRQIKEQTLYKL